MALTHALLPLLLASTDLSQLADIVTSALAVDRNDKRIARSVGSYRPRARPAGAEIRFAA